MKLNSIRVIILTLLAVILNCGHQQELKISGSETMFFMIKSISEDYMKKNSSIKVSVVGGGSEKGISELAEKKADIALSSRILSEDEFNKLKGKNSLDSVVVAYDGLAIAVNNKNTLQKITLPQLNEIFSGKKTNWKDFGGPNAKITVVIRDSHSGTAKFFKERILPKDNFTPNAKAFEFNKDLEKQIEGDVNAIGFIGMGPADTIFKGKIKTLNYAPTEKDEFISPSIENVYNRKYKLSRPLNLYYNPNKNKEIDNFISFLTSEEGQKLVMTNGYLRSSLPEIEVKGKK